MQDIEGKIKSPILTASFNRRGGQYAVILNGVVSHLCSLLSSLSVFLNSWGLSSYSQLSELNGLV